MTGLWRRLVAGCMASCVTFPAAADDASWHLLTRSRAGTVTLLKGLTKHECDFAGDRAMGRPATDAERAARCAAWQADHHCNNTFTEANGSVGYLSTSGLSYKGPDGSCVQGRDFDGVTMGNVGPGDIISAECFQ